MNNNNFIKTINFIDINDRIKLFQKRDDIFQKYFKLLIKKYFDINIEKKLFISQFCTFVMLPKYLKIVNEKILSNKKNNYKLEFKNYTRIFQTDIILPFHNLNSIPFTFFFKYDNKNKIKQSNIYYFELKIADNEFILIDNKNCISIGFGSISNNTINKHVGIQRNSIGYHSNNGYVYNGSKFSHLYLEKFTYGDIIGAGLIYISYDSYIPFFTRNGRLIKILKEIKIKGKITPQIGYNHNISFDLNFGSENFIYDIEKLIDKYNHVINTKNNFLRDFKESQFKYISKKINVTNSPNYTPLIPIQTSPIYNNNNNIYFNNLVVGLSTNNFPLINQFDSNNNLINQLESNDSFE